MAKEKLIITATKEGNELAIYIKAPEKVEKYYQNLKVGEQQSVNWKNDNGEGINFYTMTNEYLTEERTFLETKNHRVYSDFGSSLVRSRSASNEINIALLRAKGISEGITFHASNFRVGAQDLETFVKELAVILKVLIQDKIGKKTVKAMITYEI